jgi:hypothetical protein
MLTKPAALAILVLGAGALCLEAARPVQQEPAPPKKNAAQRVQKESTSTAVGCVDEQDGKYVLLNVGTMAPIADLEADGFPTEGFAKHVGHKVTVRGTRSANGARPSFKVRKVETLSETCAPQQPQQGKQ